MVCLVQIDTDVVACGYAAVRNEVKIQGFLLPDGVHHHQRLQGGKEGSAELQHEVIDVWWISDLNDEHVLPEVVPLFEDYSHRGRRGWRRHGGELQPQRLLFRSHHFAFLQLDEKKTERLNLFSETSDGSDLNIKLLFLPAAIYNIKLAPKGAGLCRV